MYRILIPRSNCIVEAMLPTVEKAAKRHTESAATDEVVLEEMMMEL